MLKRLEYFLLDKKMKLFFVSMFSFQILSLIKSNSNTPLVFSYIESNLSLFFSGFIFAGILYMKYRIYDFYYKENIITKFKNRVTWFEKIQIDSLYGVLIMWISINFLPIAFAIININKVNKATVGYFILNLMIQIISIFILTMIYDFLNLLRDSKILNFFLAISVVLIPEYLMKMLRLNLTTPIDFFMLNHNSSFKEYLNLLNIAFIVMLLIYISIKFFAKRKKIDFLGCLDE